MLLDVVAHPIYQSIQQIDYSIFQFINQTLQHPFLDSTMPWLRDKRTWLPLYFIIVYYCLKKKHYGLLIFFYLVLCTITTDIINHQLLKPYFHRLRPCYEFPNTVRLLLDGCGGKWSFPSSHAANHTAIAIGIIRCHLFTKATIKYYLLIWVALIGYAQIYVGVHYPSDILAGIVLGMIVTAIYYQLFKIVLHRMGKSSGQDVFI